MAVILSDAEIAALIRERKPLDSGWSALWTRREKGRHVEHQIDVTGANSTAFRLIVRRNDNDPADFSVVLAVRGLHSDRLFILRRYDGRTHRHKNAIEGDAFRGFHIHFATERYQRRGYREDAFAELTDRYDNVDGALRCLAADARFELPPDQPIALC